MSDAEGPYGHTPVLGNSTHTGEGCKACGDAKGPYTSYERTDGRGMVEGLNFFFDCRSISEAKRYAERLNTAYAAGRASRDGLKKALESISRNTCCETCQQAKLVALAAMKSEDDTILRRPGVA